MYNSVNVNIVNRFIINSIELVKIRVKTSSSSSIIWKLAREESVFVVHIIITDIYAAREVNTYGIKEEDIIKEIKKYGKEAFHISSYDDIKLYLSQYVNKGDLILTLGAGNVTKLADMLVNKNE